MTPGRRRRLLSGNSYGPTYSEAFRSSGSSSRRLLLSVMARPGYEVGDVAAQAVRIFAAVSGSDSGSVRVLAVAVMKLASPNQRGTTWTWRCSLTLPPATRPRL